MHLDMYYVKHVSKKARTTYDLEWREYTPRQVLEDLYSTLLANNRGIFIDLLNKIVYF